MREKVERMDLRSKSSTKWAVTLGVGLLFCQAAMSEAPKLLRSSRIQNTRPHPALVGQTTTMLPNGKLLLIGGESTSGVVATVGIKDPESGATVELKTGLLHARAWHTATLLPNGTVFVFGGEDGGENLVPTAEIFDPAMARAQELLLPQLLVRTHHTATLLTDGRVLVAGGIDAAGDFLGSMQTWDPRGGTVKSAQISLLTPRKDHMANLVADGGVLFWGGTASTGLALDYGEYFDPALEVMRVVTNADSFKREGVAPMVAASLPSAGATDVSLKPLVAVRFSRPLAALSVSARSVSLSFGGTLVDTKVVLAERGMLAFVTPTTALTASTTYILSVSGAQDVAGNEVQPFSMMFTTATASSSDGVAGLLGGTSVGDGEREPLDNSAFRLPALKGHNGETALAGQVLKLNGKPLVHVLLQIEGQKAYSDGTGRFLFENIAPGHHVMVIDGTTANHGNVEYGIYDDGVDVQIGKTTVLNYPIWMTPLDRQHEVTIPSPTTSEFIVKNPLLPGLELHLPPNTVIRDRTGNVVTRVSITPIAVSQPPFPLPQGVEVPIYFTIQPGGAYLEMPAGSWGKGAQLWYPNWRRAKPGTQFDFWNYDPENKGWYVYGEGAVSKDTHSVVPDPGVEIYQFTGAMLGSPGSAPPAGGPAGDPSNGGDPVNLSTGLFVYNKTDLVLSDVVPLKVERTYRPNDNQSRAFGIGTSHGYEMFLVGDTSAYAYQDLILPDGSRIHFYRISAGTSWTDAVLAHTASPTRWYGATIVWNTSEFAGASWVLTTKYGTKYYFPEAFGQTSPGKMALMGIRDRYGNTVTIARDSSGNITQISSPNGRSITFQHDTSNRITQVQDNLGRTVLYHYDAVGRVQQITDAAGGVWLYTYDSNNNMLTIQDARGITYLTNEYDSGNHVKKQTQADGSTYQFDWTFTSNTAQPPYFVVGASGPPGGSATGVLTFRACSTCSEGYNPLVTRVDVTDPNGNVRRLNFGPTGYTTSVTYALGKSEQQTYTYAYYADNLLQSITDPLGRMTSYTYDANGNLTSTTQLSGTSNAVSTTMTYDTTFSQIRSITDPLGHAANFDYDGSGNLITITDPLQHQTTMSYDGQGRILSVSDPLSNTSRFSYYLGDLASVSDPLSRTTMRSNDVAGRLLSLTDPLGQTTKMTYNALNQVTSVTDPLGKITSFIYDLNGNLLSVTDTIQHATTYTYDNMDRVATRKDPLQNQESYQYDGNSNLTQFMDRRGKTSTFSYDGLNRRTFAGYGMTAGPAYESSVSYTYDAGNRLMQIADSAGGTITRGYDNLDRLTSEATQQGTVSYTYDNASRRTSLTVQGQTVVNYIFDNAHRLTQITQGSSTVQFTYDVANRRTSLTLPNGVMTTYSFDSASQLTGLTYANGATPLGNITYSYDLAGRRTSVGGSLAAVNLPNAVATTSYNANDQLTTWGTANLFYDANGNMTSDGTHSYSWDARNRLAQIDLGATASFSYDGLGRRTSKTILGTQKGFLYDGVNAVQELSGTTVTANSISGGVDEVFQRTDSSGARSFLSDVLGSTVALTDSAGMVQTQYGFEPFGNTTVTGTSSSNSFAYTGREQDATGLYFYRARYYNPQLQRFISEDPIWFGSGDTNPYAYVRNSPAIYIDRSGKNPAVAAIPVLIGAGEGALAATGIGAAVAGLTALAVYDGLQAAKLIQAEWQSCDACLGLARFDPAKPPASFPDVANPPADWKPHPQGGPDRYLDPEGWTWRWHPKGNPVHPGDHWDIGGPRGPNREPGERWWWPEGGNPGPKGLLPGLPNLWGRKPVN
jgi:RHS repeat-associated protein